MSYETQNEDRSCYTCGTRLEENMEHFCSESCYNEYAQEEQRQQEQQELEQREPTREMLMDGGCWDFDNDRPR